jgi:hypothetical protein
MRSVHPSKGPRDIDAVTHTPELGAPLFLRLE